LLHDHFRIDFCSALSIVRQGQDRLLEQGKFAFLLTSVYLCVYVYIDLCMYLCMYV
jgi:hypothetical protein